MYILGKCMTIFTNTSIQLQEIFHKSEHILFFIFSWNWNSRRERREEKKIHQVSSHSLWYTSSVLTNTFYLKVPKLISFEDEVYFVWKPFVYLIIPKCQHFLPLSTKTNILWSSSTFCLNTFGIPHQSKPTLSTYKYQNWCLFKIKNIWSENLKYTPSIQTIEHFLPKSAKLISFKDHTNILSENLWYISSIQTNTIYPKVPKLINILCRLRIFCLRIFGIPHHSKQALSTFKYQNCYPLKIKNIISDNLILYLIIPNYETLSTLKYQKYCPKISKVFLK